LGIHWLQAFIFFFLGAFFGPWLLSKVTGKGKQSASY
jgi:hypothetical protein